MKHIEDFVRLQDSLQAFQNEVVSIASEHKLHGNIIDRHRLEDLFALGNNLKRNWKADITGIECDIAAVGNLQGIATLLLTHSHGGIILDVSKELSFLVENGIATREELQHLGELFEFVSNAETSNAMSCRLYLYKYLNVPQPNKPVQAKGKKQARILPT